ncbi:MAG: hypothetical protein BWX63_02149 [Bacteroidetes bacterium ADurb.Bin041]|nr:MAG: hypothetical protein BWX63_02149 [Bacteroidetes bacterium ADurb.Bin041]
MPMPELASNFLGSDMTALMIMYGLAPFPWKPGFPMSFHSGGQAMAILAGLEMYL